MPVLAGRLVIVMHLVRLLIRILAWNIVDSDRAKKQVVVNQMSFQSCMFSKAGIVLITFMQASALS